MCVYLFYSRFRHLQNLCNSDYQKPSHSNNNECELDSLHEPMNALSLVPNCVVKSLRFRVLKANCVFNNCVIDYNMRMLNV